MADYQLSTDAKARLIEIEAWTAQRFGTYQADAYITGFQKTFELIAMCQRRSDFAAAGRRDIASLVNA